MRATRPSRASSSGTSSIYVVGDERDLIRVRTNYRRDPPEDVYLYRVRGPAENARRLFLEYVRAINALQEQPRFYDTLTTNCTTTILLHTRVNPGHLPLSWKVLLSGHAAEYVYEPGRLDTSLPFEELRGGPGSTTRRERRIGRPTSPGASARGCRSPTEAARPGPRSVSEQPPHRPGAPSCPRVAIASNQCP